MVDQKKIVSDYGKVVEILSKIVYFPVYPESLLPYPKKIIKDALEYEKMNIEIVCLVRERNNQQVEKEHAAYLDALISGLDMLEHSFIEDSIAIDKNERVKRAIQGAISMMRENTGEQGENPELTVGGQGDNPQH